MGRAWVVVILAIGLVTAGCIGDDTDPDEQLDEQTVDEAPGDVNRLVAHTGDGIVPVPEEVEDLVVRVADTGYSGAEPTLGVLSDGTIVTNPSNAANNLILSEDHGQTWTEVGDPVTNPKINLDPWMWVDPITDRIYNGPLYVVCSWVSWSDDRGESWTANPVAGCGPPAHDHQKITTGPPADGVTTLGYPNVVYYSYNSFRGEGTWITRSLDGGHTFDVGQSVHPADDCRGGVAGPVHVGPDGTAYSAKATCQGTRVMVSHDSGMSWEEGIHTDNGMYDGLAINPDVGTDNRGNAYLASPGEDGRLYMTMGGEQGTAWGTPIPVSPPDVNFTQFSVVTAGEPGHVAFAYLGTRDNVSAWEEPNPSNARDEAVWHLFITTTTTAMDTEPVFVTRQVTPEEDPVQRGCIWLNGGGNECRNLLDFIDMVEHEGRPYITYSDGCDACSSADTSRERDHKIAILEEGPGLLGGVLEPLIGNATDAVS